MMIIRERLDVRALITHPLRIRCGRPAAYSSRTIAAAPRILLEYTTQDFGPRRIAYRRVRIGRARTLRPMQTRGFAYRPAITRRRTLISRAFVESCALAPGIARRRRMSAAHSHQFGFARATTDFPTR